MFVDEFTISFIFVETEKRQIQIFHRRWSFTQACVCGGGERVVCSFLFCYFCNTSKIESARARLQTTRYIWIQCSTVDAITYGTLNISYRTRNHLDFRRYGMCVCVVEREIESLFGSTWAYWRLLSICIYTLCTKNFHSINSNKTKRTFNNDNSNNFIDTEFVERERAGEKSQRTNSP